MTTILSTETWKSIPGYEGLYEVSDLGRVRSLDRIDTAGRRCKGRVLKPRPNEWNRYSVYLCKDGYNRIRKVHQLVLEAFVGPRPEGYEACHKNDESTDNRLDNLYWGTREQNIADQKRNGKFVSYNGNATHCRRGHPFDDTNTLRVWHATRGKYQRKCGECHRAYEAGRRRKQ